MHLTALPSFRPAVLVPRILSQVRVGDDLVRRQRVQVEMRPGCDTRRRATLKGPEVGAPGEPAEADQVGTAVTLPEQLTAPLVLNEIEGELDGRNVSVVVLACPLTLCIDLM